MACNTFSSDLISSSIKMVTFNMHGYNQGALQLQELCDTLEFDLILLNEIWLVPALMHKILNFHNSYKCYGRSAMENLVSTGLLKGRPYGGCAILVRNSFVNLVSNIITYDRVVSITLCDMMFINVYLPCESGSADDWNNLHEIIANICDVIENSDATFIIVGGDMNVNCSRDTPHARVLNDFCKTYNLMPANNMAPSEEIKVIEYTFCNEKLKQFSLIDYFCVSSSLQSSVLKYSTIRSEEHTSELQSRGLI